MKRSRRVLVQDERCGSPDSRDCCDRDADLTPITGGLDETVEVVQDDDPDPVFARVPVKTTRHHMFTDEQLAQHDAEVAATALEQAADALDAEDDSDEPAGWARDKEAVRIIALLRARAARLRATGRAT
jgi:hypothetical protein